MEKFKCVSCGKDKYSDAFSKRSDGSQRIKCNGCLLGYDNHRLSKTNPAPQDDHQLPNIVKEALEEPQEEIETFELGQKNYKPKMAADVLLGKQKYTRGGKQ